MRRNSSFQRSLEAIRAREREQEEKERRQCASDQEETDQQAEEEYADEASDEDDRYEKSGLDCGDDSWEEIPELVSTSHWGCIATGIGVVVIVLIIVLFRPVLLVPLNLEEIGVNVESLLGMRMSEEELAKEVKKDVAKELGANQGLRKFNLRVLDVTLLHEYGNCYSGMVIVKFNQKEISNNIEVVYDGNRYYWEIIWSGEMYEEAIREPLEQWNELMEQLPGGY